MSKCNYGLQQPINFTPNQKKKVYTLQTTSSFRFSFMGATVASKRETRSGAWMRLNSQPLRLHTSQHTTSSARTCFLLLHLISPKIWLGIMMREAVRALVALWLWTLHGCRNSEAAPNLSSPLQSSNWGNPRRYVHLRTSTELNNFYLEISLTGHVRKTTHRGSYSECASFFSFFFLRFAPPGLITEVTTWALQLQPWTQYLVI